MTPGLVLEFQDNGSVTQASAAPKGDPLQLLVVLQDSAVASARVPS